MGIRVLVVDDSAFMRKLISEILSSEPDIDVVATARNGRDALDKLARLQVDVVTLDVEMPVMDGITTLEHIMKTRPIPVVMLSSLTKRGSEITIKAVSLGAVDFVLKPSGSISLDLKTIGADIVAKVKAAALAKVESILRKQPFMIEREPKIPAPTSGVAANIVVAIGSSTGGPKAVEEVLSNIPASIKAGILITQHMPKEFTRSFAERLDRIVSVSVKEAEHGDLVEAGRAYVAPVDYHMTVGNGRRIFLNQDPPVQFLRPSVDVTMASLPRQYGNAIVGVILTGMGKDGAKGMSLIKQANGITIAQDKGTSVIYSMPRAVAEEGNADYILPLGQIGQTITQLVAKMSR